MTLRIRPRIVLEATLWQGEPFEGLDRVPGDNGGHELIIQTLGLGVSISPGDWIIRGNAGQFFGCPAALFEETYEVVE